MILLWLLIDKAYSNFNVHTSGADWLVAKYEISIRDQKQTFILYNFE
jgi:hypothetical protein